MSHGSKKRKSERRGPRVGLSRSPGPELMCRYVEAKDSLVNPERSAFVAAIDGVAAEGKLPAVAGW